MTPITDPLNSVSVGAAAAAAFRAVDALQGEPPAVQVAGVAMLYALLTYRLRVDPRDALAQADRRIADALSGAVDNIPGDTVRALRMYLREEV